MRLAYGTALLLLLAPAAASANVVVTLAETRDAGQAPRESKVFLEPDRVRFGTTNGGMIYRDDRKTMWILDDSEHRYFEMTPESRAQMRQTMDEGMRRMQEQMKSMPEAQRKQIEQMMRQHGAQMPGATQAPPTVTYTKLAPGKTVGRWRCDEYEQKVDGQKTAELCLATLSDLGLTRKDVQALFSMFDEASQLAGPMRAGQQAYDFKSMSAAAGRDVLPVRWVSFEDGARKRETVMKSVDRASIPPDTFEVPKGYTKRDMTGMSGR